MVGSSGKRSPQWVFMDNQYSESSLVDEVKSKKNLDPLLMELNESVL